MTVNPLTLSIRSKKLGVLVRDARLATGKSVEECARAIGVSAGVLDEYELGEKSPSLPELEALAYSFNIPLEHFWGEKTLSRRIEHRLKSNLEQIVALRQRMIGAQVRKARREAGLSLEELAKSAWSSVTLLEAYELGEMPIPLPDLEVLSGLLNCSIKDFQDQRGPVGAWAIEQRNVQEFLTLPPELQDFVSKPVNRPYLQLAQRLSEMSVDKLRAVAEGLLEITL